MRLSQLVQLGLKLFCRLSLQLLEKTSDISQFVAHNLWKNSSECPRYLRNSSAQSPRLSEKSLLYMNQSETSRGNMTQKDTECITQNKFPSVTKDEWAVMCRRGLRVGAQKLSECALTLLTSYWLSNGGLLAVERSVRSGNWQAWDQDNKKFSLLVQARMFLHERR